MITIQFNREYCTVYEKRKKKDVCVGGDPSASHSRENTSQALGLQHADPCSSSQEMTRGRH